MSSSRFVRSSLQTHFTTSGAILRGIGRPLRASSSPADRVAPGNQRARIEVTKPLVLQRLNLTCK
jgi:hypothetical protein